jgi:hypothetical protein
MQKLRDNGIITESDYRGKTLEDATQYAVSGGFEIRIVEENGIPKMLDMSVKSNRINFRVNNGRVTAAFGG